MSKYSNRLNRPTVSILMPTFNRADLLPTTIKSILSQEFRDFELLIVDDGSSDSTASVINRIGQSDSRVRYVPLGKNRGVGFAREASSRLASGRYVALADSDDLWLPGKLEAQVTVLEDYPQIDILFSDYNNFDHVEGVENTGFSKTYLGMKELTTKRLDAEVFFVENGLEIGILRKNFVQPATMLLRSDVFQRFGTFDPTLWAVDHEYCWRVAVLGARYGYIDRPLLERHRYQSSVTANATDAQLQLLICLETCRATAISEGRPDLIAHLRAAELRTSRNLIHQYCDRSERAMVWLAYKKSLRYGFSLRTFTFFIIALGGSHAMSSALKLRARSLRVA